MTTIEILSGLGNATLSREQGVAEFVTLGCHPMEAAEIVAIELGESKGDVVGAEGLPETASDDTT